MGEGRFTYHRRAGVDASHGSNFEWDLTSLVYLRLEKLHEQWEKTGNSGVESFFIANSMQNVGAFDDVVVRVEYADGLETKTKLIFVQCKHAVDSRKSCTRFQKHMQPNTIKAYFDSFLRIRKILLEKDVSVKLLDKIKNKSLKSELHKKQTKDIQQIKKLLNCNYNDFELLFYSNMETDYEQFSEMLEYNENKMPGSDCVAEAFNTAGSTKYDVRFKEAAFHKFVDCMGYCEKDRFVLKTEFCNKFRMFFNQANDLEFHVNKETAELIGSTQNVEFMRFNLLKEINLHFNKSDYCEPLTEKNKLLRNVEGYFNLKSKAMKTVDNFYGELRTSSYFSEETMNIMEQNLNSKILRISTGFKNLEKLKLIQFFITLSLRCLLLFLEDAIDISDWICARNMQTYKTFSRVYICSDVLDTDISFNDYPLYENEIFIQYVHQDEQNYYFDQFSQKCQDLILNSIVYFQGVAVKLIDICRKDWNYLLNENLIFGILQKTIINIGQQLPTTDYCLPKKFLMEILKDEYKTKQLNKEIKHENNFIMFTENNAFQDDENYPVYFKDFASARHFVCDLNLKFDNTYLICQLMNRELQLLYSFGKQGDYTKKKLINEEDILDINRKITFLAVETQTETSRFSISLAQKYKLKNPNHWVYVINNRNHKKFEDIHSASVVQFVAESLLDLEGIERDLFKKSCTEIGNAALFFDAFDDMSEKECIKFDSFLLDLSQTKVSRIFVSSRPMVINFLEKSHLCKSHTFIEPTNDNSIQFLINVWNEKLKIRNHPTNEKLLLSIAKILISTIESEGKIMKEILEIPLQTKMTSDNYLESPSQVSNLLKLDLYGFYNNFIKFHVQRSILEKSELKGKNLGDEFSKMSLSRILSEHLVLPKMSCVPELLRKSTENLEKPIAICLELNLLTNLDPQVFVQRTISEFFAAKYIVNTLTSRRGTEDLVFIFKHLLIDSKYNVVRKFINNLLMEVNIPETEDKASKYNVSKLFNCKSESTPLHIAATEGNMDIIKLLLQHDENLLNTQTVTLVTPLHLACANENIEIVRYLLSRYDSLEKLQDIDGNTILHVASRAGMKNTTELILKYCDSLHKIKNKRGESPLHVACISRHTEVVQSLISKYKSIKHLIDNDGNTILHVAAIAGKNDLVKLILKQCPSILHVKNYAGKTPLQLTIIANNSKTTETRIKKCSDIKSNDADELLHYAFKNENMEVMKLLLNFDDSWLKSKYSFNHTSLHLAIIANNEKAVKLLLTFKECSVHDVDNAGNTALHLASKIGNTRIIVSVLLRDREHSLMKKQNNKGETPLYLTCVKNNNEAFMLLLTHKECPLKMCTFNGDSVLHAALENENMEVINLILEHDATLVNFQNSNRETPLHLAIRKNNVNILKSYICCSDCSVDETHLQYASRNGSSTEVMKLLLHHKKSSISMKNRLFETHLDPTIRKNTAEMFNTVATLPESHRREIKKEKYSLFQNAGDEEVKKLRFEQCNSFPHDIYHTRQNPLLHFERKANPSIPHFHHCPTVFPPQHHIHVTPRDNLGMRMGWDEEYRPGSCDDGYGRGTWNEWYGRYTWGERNRHRVSRESRVQCHPFYPMHSTEARDSQRRRTHENSDIHFTQCISPKSHVSKDADIVTKV